MTAHHDRFELLAELGAGGMGSVWKARDTETGDLVALKLVHPHLARDPDYVARFEREVEVARRVDSPHVVRVLGYGTRDGMPFMSMEYVEGQSLRELLKERGKLTWDEAKPIVRQVAEGLGAAHAAGIIHRDVKPSNILITPDGDAKLADFGIARALDMTRLTGSSTMLGTPHYMAPDTEVTPASDLYSLGCVVYEMLTGRPPFDGDTQQQVMYAHLRDTIRVAALPKEAGAAVSWLTSREAGARPASGREFARMLSAESIGRDAGYPRPGLKVVAGLLGLAAVGAAAGVALLATSERGEPATPIVDGPDIAAPAATATPLDAVIVERFVALDDELHYIEIGPYRYAGDELEISTRFVFRCDLPETIDWISDVNNPNVFLLMASGEHVLATAGTGLNDFEGAVPCGSDETGTLTFQVGDDEPVMLYYAGPLFSAPIPLRSGDRPSYENQLEIVSLSPPSGSILTVGDQIDITVNYATSEDEGVRLWAETRAASNLSAVFSNPSPMYYFAAVVDCCYLGVVDEYDPADGFKITKIAVKMARDERDSGGELVELAGVELDVDYTFVRPDTAGDGSFTDADDIPIRLAVAQRDAGAPP